MPYDEHIAKRLRDVLSGQEGITEKKMFGGLAFLLHGNMTVSASGRGGLLVRVDPADTGACLARPHAELMRMGGRSMEGWISVGAEGLGSKQQLAEWVDRSLTYVRRLPRK